MQIEVLTGEGAPREGIDAADPPAAPATPTREQGPETEHFFTKLLGQGAPREGARAERGSEEKQAAVGIEDLERLRGGRGFLEKLGHGAEIAMGVAQTPRRPLGHDWFLQAYF
jgi:hypothetical protein